MSVPGREDTVELKYQLLNPSPNFMDVVEEARAVILAGGTMSPVRSVLRLRQDVYLRKARSDVRCYQPAIFPPSIGEDYIFFMWAHHTRRKSPSVSCE